MSKDLLLQDPEGVLTSQIKNEFRRFLIEEKATQRASEIRDLLKQAFNGSNTLLIDLEGRRGIRKELKKAEQLCQQLVEEELLIDTDFAEIAEELGENLLEQFNIPGLALVLVGSGIHGGRQIRKLFSTEGIGDFDWGLVADVNLGEIHSEDVNSLDNIVSFVSSAVSKIAKKRNLELKACDTMNGFTLNEKNISSVKELISKILRFNSFEVYNLAHELVFYFQPSFPAEANEKNREKILEALKIIAHADSKKWSVVVNAMIGSWQGLHVIKRKHIGRENYTVDDYKAEDKKRNELRESSSQAMSKRFREMLEATKA